MTAAALVDETARAAIEHDLDRNLFVEAAAGTGKTTALVSRIVRVVATGRARLREVAAITFTEKAAAELRDRLREALERAAREGPDDERARCAAALHELDDAAVTTLHAFAQRILAEYPLEAGMPPQLEVLDEIAAGADFDASWERFVARLLGADDEVVRVALTLGLRPDHLRDLAAELRAHWDRLEGVSFPTPPLPRVDVEPLVRPLASALGRASVCTDPDDLMARHLDSLVGYLDWLRATPPDPGGVGLETLAVLMEAPTLKCRRGRKGAWGDGPVLDEVRTLLDEAQGALADLLGGVRRACLLHLAERLRAFTLREAERRRQEGRLAFHDLLVVACDLLRRHPGVRARSQHRWRRLHIDESQDTDPLQIELAVLLASGDDAHRPWYEAELEPGRLFLVGDPKQSIYRFRRADIGLYRRIEERFGDDVVTLGANFRSASPVIEFVNGVFEPLMGEGDAGVQAPYAPLRSTREVVAPSVRGIGDEHERPVREVRELEADELAGLVRSVLDDGWLVHDRASGETRPARYDDIGVLLPTRRLLPELERALVRHDVPYRIESQSLLYSTQEVRDLLAVLRAVDDPADQVALIAALRSPAFACRDDDLLNYRRHGGAWSALAPRPADLPDDHPVVQALDALFELHRQRHWLPLHSVVERVVRDRHLLEVYTATGRPRDHWRRIRLVADQARAFTESGGATLRAFLDWADQRADEEARIDEAIVPEPDDDAVRILTIHAAKGLEFGIVMLAGLNAAPRSTRPPVLFGRHGEIELSLGTERARFETLGYDALLTRERAAENAERVRLLYVATTRARDHLVVSLHHKLGDARCPARTLIDACALDPLWHEPGGGPGPRTESEGGDADAQPTLELEPEREARDAWLARRGELVETLGRAPVLAATAVAAAVGAERNDTVEPDTVEPDDTAEPDERAPWQRGRAGTSLGRAVHAVLQTVDLATGEGLDETAHAQAAAEGIPERAAEVRRLARAALESPIVRRAVASGRLWREVYVGVPVEGVTLEGFVDLLFEDDDGLVVVDYKTDRVADPDLIADRYSLQIASYALALEAAVGRPVSRGVLLFVGTGRAVEHEVADLAGARDAVRRVLTTAR